MGILVENGHTAPALKYDRVFMQSMSITQKSEADNGKPPVYGLRVEYRLYAVDQENYRHFLSKVKVVSIQDYLSEAMVKAQQGDMGLLGALQAIEAALATIIRDTSELGEVTVV